MTIPAFVDYSPATPITASFLNPVATAVFGALGDASNNPPTTAADVLANLGLSSSVGAGGASKIGFDGTTLDQQFLARVNRVVDTIAALAGLNPAVYTRAFATGYYAASDGGGGAYTYSATTLPASANGGTIVASTFAGATGCWLLANTSVVSLKQFGARANGTDDATFVNTALAWAAAGNYTLDISGNFSVTQVTLSGASGLCLRGRGSFVGIATGATDSILTLIDCVDLSIDGRLAINGNYNTNYTYGLHAYTNGLGSTNVAYLDFTNLIVTACQSAYGFGIAGRPNDQVSEINIRGGYTFGCPNVVTAIGAQTVVNFASSNLISSFGNGNAGWQAIVQYTVIAIGATVTLTGGELLHAQTSTGAAVQVQPIAASGGNIYGNVTCTGVVVECASLLASSLNSGALATPTQGAIRFVGCRGVCTYSGAAQWIQTDASFGAGNVIQFSGNDFFATNNQANGTINCGAACDVWCDDASFRANFSSAIAGILGSGVPRYTHRQILLASNLNGQFFPVSTTTSAVFTVLDNTGDKAHYAGAFSGGTFTVPAGGLATCKISTQIQSLTAIVSGEIYVEINGVATGKALYNKYGQATLDLGALTAGTTIKVGVLNNSGSTNAGTTSMDYMAIYASN
jgi:hypothetical protein